MLISILYRFVSRWFAVVIYQWTHCAQSTLLIITSFPLCMECKWSGILIWVMHCSWKKQIGEPIHVPVQKRTTASQQLHITMFINANKKSPMRKGHDHVNAQLHCSVHGGGTFFTVDFNTWQVWRLNFQLRHILALKQELLFDFIIVIIAGASTHFYILCNILVLFIDYSYSLTFKCTLFVLF